MNYYSNLANFPQMKILISNVEEQLNNVKKKIQEGQEQSDKFSKELKHEIRKLSFSVIELGKFIAYPLFFIYPEEYGKLEFYWNFQECIDYLYELRKLDENQELNDYLWTLKEILETHLGLENS